MEILHPIFIVAHLIFAVAMIAVVLLQTGKGAGLSGVFGGGGAASESFFGGRGPGTFLAKLTTVAAIMFMVTSLVLAKLSTMPRGGRSVMDDEKTKTEEKAPPTPKAPAAPVSEPAPEEPAAPEKPAEETPAEKEPAPPE
ncbi:MAG: preprotein translocase subunit SecG [Candidatus Coatesbacteria bacterium]|nr:MAG: preprotein translocase subunit SecG [Candidatus Coatesbacteria bacterium]